MKIFRVEGYRFPHDMLRYDECFPASGEDAEKIYHSNHGRVKKHKICLKTNCTPTEKRWESFGWKILKNRESCLEQQK